MIDILRLTKKNIRRNFSINLVSSKSETNRVLIIQALSDAEITLNNLSKARDSETMQQLLANLDAPKWDVIDAGTTMRFLTAFAAVKCEEKVLTGSERMQQRPIAPLVDCLRELGADIKYLKNEGFPPLQVKKIKEQQNNHIQIAGNISSQYISALLMIAPLLPNGLEIEFTTEVFSRPYIEMTLDLMTHFGIKYTWNNQIISIQNADYKANNYTIEGDWSGASYWYTFVLLSEDENASIQLPNLKENSFQGDSQITEIMEHFGVKTTFYDDYIEISKNKVPSKKLKLDFKKFPDLAQTVLVVAAAKGVELELTGLESLKIKETNRVKAMQNELQKINAQLIELDEHYWKLVPSEYLPNSAVISTYDDHRMAMAFAPLCMLMDIGIETPEVVKKSYPNFWEEVEMSLR